jgi:hypothetical protein
MTSSTSAANFDHLQAAGNGFRLTKNRTSRGPNFLDETVDEQYRCTYSIMRTNQRASPWNARAAGQAGGAVTLPELDCIMEAGSVFSFSKRTNAASTGTSCTRNGRRTAERINQFC